MEPLPIVATERFVERFRAIQGRDPALAKKVLARVQLLSERRGARHVLKGVRATSGARAWDAGGDREDLRLVLSYGQHDGDTCVELWTLGGHDHIFTETARIFGARQN